MLNVNEISNFYNLTDEDYAYLLAALEKYCNYLDALETFHFDMVDFLENYCDTCCLPEIEVDLDNHNFWHNTYRNRLEKATELMQHIERNRALCYPFSED